MKYFLTFLALLLPGLLLAQSLDIRKAQVANYSMDNGWLNSMTVDMEIDAKGYIYFSNQRFELFDGQKVEQIKVPSPGDNEFLEIERVDSLHFLLCADECFLFNTETQEFELLLSTPGLWHQQYTDSDGKLKILQNRIGEYTFDKGAKKTIRFDSLPHTLFDSIFLSGTDQLLHLKKIKYDPVESTMSFYNSAYKKQGDAKLRAPLKNMECTDSLVLALTDRLEIFDKKGNRLREVAIPNGMSLFALSDIIQFSSDEFLVNLAEGLFVFNSSKMAFVNEIRNSQNQAIILNEYFRRVIKDGVNLHILAHFSGYYRLNFLEYHLNNFVIPEGNKSIKAVTADTANNKVLLANQLGEFYHFEQNGNLLQKIKEIPQAFSASGIVKIGDNVYLLCHSKACYQIQFAKDNSYQVSEVLTGELGSYYANIYLHQDTINIYNQNNRIQIPKANPTNIQLKPAEVFAYQAIVKGKKICWHENSPAIYIDKGIIIDTIPIPSQLGAPICQTLINDSTLLIGGRKGLYELNLREYSISDYGEIDDWVYSIQPYKEYFFCSTNQGIIIVKNRSIIKRLTKADGLCSQEFNTNVSHKDQAGNLYFGGAMGLVSFSPQEILDADTKLQRSARSFRIDEDREARLQDERITLEAGERSLSFRISTIGANPSADYNSQYIIPAISNSWIDVGRNSTINLTLSPGEYELFYHSSNFFDPNALAVQSFKIKVKEYWYKTTWFYACGILLLNLLVIGAITSYYQFKTVLQLKSLAAKEKLNTEKMRISRDLHDSLGTQMAMVGRNIDWLTENMNDLPTTKIKENLDAIVAVSRETNQSLRDSIWAFKQATFNTQELSDRARNLIDRYRKLNHGVDIVFASHLAGDYPLTPSASLNIIRIIQEGIGNAMKHSACDKVEITLVTNNQQLSLTIQDNGQGFEVDTNSRGEGLSNIEDRAEEIGAVVVIKSIPDVGTKIKLQLKLNLHDS